MRNKKGFAVLLALLVAAALLTMGAVLTKISFNRLKNVQLFISGQQAYYLAEHGSAPLSYPSTSRYNYGLESVGGRTF